MRLSIKVALICAIAAAVPLIVSSVIITRSASANVREAAIKKSQSQCAAAASMYEKRLLEMRSATQALADAISVNALLDGTGQGEAGPARARLQDLLTHARDDFSLDFLIVTDAAGNVVARHNDVPAAGETISMIDKGDPIAQRVLESGSRSQVSPLTAGVVESSDFLSKMWMDKSAKVTGSTQNGALVVEAGAPIFTAGRFSGVLLAGQMLNNYFLMKPGASSIRTPLVAEIREKLLAGSESSGALIALGDTVVASSVVGTAGGEPLFKGMKCRPGESFETLNGNGVEYGVAWKPVIVVNAGGSLDKAAVGVAIPLEQLFRGSTSAFNALAAALGLDLLLAGMAGLLFGRIISRRLNSLTEAVRRMSVGDLGTSVSETDSAEAAGGSSFFNISANGSGSKDEIGALAYLLDQMRESFRQAIERQRKR